MDDGGVPWWVCVIDNGIATPKLRELCKSDQLLWYDFMGGVAYNVLGWAIQLGDTPLARDIARWCSRDNLLHPCFKSSRKYDHMTPLVFAMVRGRTNVVIALLERGVRPSPEDGLRIMNAEVDAHMDEVPIIEYRMCKRIAHARRAALTVLLGGYRDECALAVLPREMIELVARTVYATRADESWIY